MITKFIYGPSPYSPQTSFIFSHYSLEAEQRVASSCFSKGTFRHYHRPDCLRTPFTQLSARINFSKSLLLHIIISMQIRATQTVNFSYTLDYSSINCIIPFGWNYLGLRAFHGFTS